MYNVAIFGYGQGLVDGQSTTIDAVQVFINNASIEFNFNPPKVEDFHKLDNGMLHIHIASNDMEDPDGIDISIEEV